MGSIKEKQCIKLHIVLRKRLEALLTLGRGGTPQGLNKPSIGKICTAQGYSSNSNTFATVSLYPTLLPNQIIFDN